jgi:hypothetical protein
MIQQGAMTEDNPVRFRIFEVSRAALRRKVATL